MALLIVSLARTQVRLFWFITYLALRLIQYAGLSFLTYRSDLYRQWWISSEAVLLVSLALATVECYAAVTREIFELGRIGRVVALVSIGLAMGAALATSADASANWSARLATAAQAKRALLTFFSVALMAVVWFYHRLPVPVPSYVWPHARILMFYLGTHAAGYWAIAVVGNEGTDLLNQLLTLIWCGCLAAWLWLFSKPIRFPPNTSTEDLSTANRLARALERVVDQ